MALTKITRGVIKANENYDTHNINSTGIVTAVSANFTGDVSIGGTLTYQDVTNIDSVGLVTARSGLHVTGGSIGIGTISPSGPVHAHVASGTQRSYLEASAAHSFLRLKSGSTSYNSGVEFFSGASNIANINGLGAGGLQFEVNGSERLRITSGGLVGIGTNNPDELLEVGDGTVSGALKVSGQSSSVTSDGFTVDWESSSNSTRFFSEPSSGGSSAIRFFTTNSGTRSEKLRITSGGNVGINTTTFAANGTNFKVSDGTISRLALDKTGANARKFEIGNFGTGLNVYDVTADEERLRITSAGLVGIDVTSPATTLDVNGTLQLRASGNTTYATRIYSRLDSTHCSVIESYLNSSTAFEMMGTYADGGGANPRVVISATAKNVGINETSPDTNLHISRSSSQNDTHGILKVESTSTGTGAATNAGIITKNRYGWSQFMQWEENGLRVGSRSTTTGGDGKVTVTYGADNTGAVINENGVVTMPQQCGFHVVLHTSQTLTNNGTVNQWDTDASDSRSYIKNMTFNAGRFVAPVSGLYYFTAQLLLSGVGNSDDSIHIAWTTGSGNDTFAYWNTRHDGASANGSYGYGGYLPVTGSTTVYLAANAIFGIRANFTGGIGIHGTDANWGHWSGFLVG